MTIEGAHPELGAEQAYVDRAYAYLEGMLDEVRKLRFTGGNEVDRDAFEAWRAIRVRALSDTISALVFGRIDEREGDTHYIGRHHVRDGGYDTIVVDWRAPVARSFYQARPTEPMGLRRRRHFLVDGREVLGIADDDLEHGGEAEPLRGAEILHRELERQRGGVMRDIVSTIQAEQDAIIRAPLDGLVVVQGGPGTGKTAIGLHRAAYLLYEHRRLLVRTGVLVVGPNPVFIRYVSQVLPSLGESAVTQVAVPHLAAWGRLGGADEPATARLKGDARMAEVLRRALDERSRPPRDEVELAVRSVRFVLPAAVVEAEAATLRERGVAYAEGRELLRDRLLVLAYRAYVEAVGDDGVTEDFTDVLSTVRRDPVFRSALDTVWPAVTPMRLLADLYASPSRLARCTEGLLSAGERRLLRRPRAKRATEQRWTPDDRALLDEARGLIEGPGERYGHVVVDEAQDLSPMQLRMLARRCPRGSMTVLGDLGQATGVWAHDDWDEVVAHLPAPEGVRVEELTLGYRVAAEIVELAAGILAEAAPALRAPASVRREPGRVRVEAVASSDRAARVAAAAGELTERGGAVAVIVPEAVREEIVEGLREARLPFGDADRSGLEEPLTLVGARHAKGLEFDAVVLVEPSRVVQEGGLRLLYVAVTRAMRALTVVHAEPLPEPMVTARGGGAGAGAAAAAGPGPPPPATGPSPQRPPDRPRASAPASPSCRGTGA